MGALRTVGGVAGLVVAVGAAVGLGLALKAPWQVIAFFAFLFGLVGVRVGSRTLPSIGEHKLLLQICPVLGALAGFALGIALVHGLPAKGDFGWPVVACCAVFAGLGLVLPFVALSKLVPVRCGQCGGRCYLGTDSTFFRKVLAKYHYRCRSCGRTEEADFSRPVV